jgi:hypothetical protein
MDTILKYKQHIGPFLRFEHESNPTVNHVTLPMRLFWTEIADATINLPAISIFICLGFLYYLLLHPHGRYYYSICELQSPEGNIRQRLGGVPLFS